MKPNQISIQNFQHEFLVQNPEFENHPLWQQLDENSKVLLANEKMAFDQTPCRFVFLGQPDYPEGLTLISDPPLALSCSGDLAGFNFMQSLSVVGSREPHELTQSWMKEEFYSYLKKFPQPIVSGGARGVDQLAHQISIFLDCPTCVVLPSGLNCKYPKLWNENLQWQDRKVTFLSEIPLSKPISKYHFSSRNRLITGLSSRLLIVEAKAKSGTLMTAHLGLVEGRDVGVVPGHPKMSQFQGSLSLLEQGAQLIRHAGDLADKFS
ncbi:MAG: DNA-processing protein DprA [Bdellovibrionales bacterium]